MNYLKFLIILFLYDFYCDVCNQGMKEPLEPLKSLK